MEFARETVVHVYYVRGRLRLNHSRRYKNLRKRAWGAGRADNFQIIGKQSPPPLPPPSPRLEIHIRREKLIPRIPSRTFKNIGSRRNSFAPAPLCMHAKTASTTTKTTMKVHFGNPIFPKSLFHLAHPNFHLSFFPPMGEMWNRWIVRLVTGGARSGGSF